MQDLDLSYVITASLVAVMSFLSPIVICLINNFHQAK